MALSRKRAEREGRGSRKKKSRKQRRETVWLKEDGRASMGKIVGCEK
jgi:hypothetical protein